ncbi:MAG: RidA family protein [Nitrospirae bacterium]|nr:RidA family protein [Nitrospirota bacterium]
MSIADRLRKTGIVLPSAPRPAGNYVPLLKAGRFVYVSGQLPIEDGKVTAKGRVGENVTVEEAYQAARLCALHALGVFHQEFGDLEQIRRTVRVAGYVRAAKDFSDIAKVVNGASDLLVQVLGNRGKHARVAVGVAELPLGAAVEIEVIFEYRAYVAEPLTLPIAEAAGGEGGSTE